VDLAAKDADFFNGFMRQIMLGSSSGEELDRTGFRMKLSFIEDMKPRDQVHATLGLQMATINELLMKYLGRLGRSQTPTEAAIYGRLVTTLARTYNDQIETHKRYGRADEPRVRVPNASDQDVGRAILARLTQNTDVALPKAGPPPLAITDNRQPLAIADNRQRGGVPRVRLDKHE
jgi:hypothetical protein